ncbi:DgyrCDS11687 [Dimorphilus gyrociliatus]|uniref:tRNA (adenine(58)-N(1))-methyltransferase n=1 Tax=Dimorphilus gyrociliatus TaxID=2664684 RepID=A0A7I8W5Z2_9ANNE|nr:DgyrCDS11687 [Dimorphilus gyrociliatus]
MFTETETGNRKNLLQFCYLPRASFHRFLDKKKLSEGDGVFLLYKTSNGQIKDKFIRELEADSSLKTKNLGNIEHNSILNRIPGDYITSNTGREFLLQKPSLGRYVKHLSRASWIPNSLLVSKILCRGAIKPGMNILEVGSGSGCTTLLLSELVGHSGFIHSIDKSKNSTTIAKNNFDKWRKLYKQNYPTDDFKWPNNVKFDSVQSAEDLPSNLKYDLAYIDIPKPSDILLPISRHIKPGSCVLVYNANAQSERIFKKETTLRLSSLERFKDRREVPLKTDIAGSLRTGFQDNQLIEKLLPGDVIKTRKGEQFYAIEENVRHKIGEELYDEICLSLRLIESSPDKSIRFYGYGDDNLYTMIKDIAGNRIGATREPNDSFDCVCITAT